MNRNSLTTAVIAGIAGVAGIANMASAVNLNPDGLGQVLLYPYYTVTGHQQTLLSIVNTDAVDGKAVKVRFLEGYNSREVLDFNLFLSPADVWTATLFELADGGLPASDPNNASVAGAITTGDKSCVAPAFGQTRFGGGSLPNGDPYQPFVNFAFSGGNADSGPTGVSRTEEGHFEMIQMADIPPASDLAGDVFHVDGVPPDCADAEGDFEAAKLLTAPSPGSLFGAASVVNVSAGTFYAYNADALDGFTLTPLITGTGSLTPSLSQVNGIDPANVTSYVFSGGRLLTSSYPENLTGTGFATQVDAVSSVFAAENLYNDYEFATNGGSGSDWVINFPTKRFYVDKQTFGLTAVVQPFEYLFGSTAAGNGAGLSCVVVDLTSYDREEGQATIVTGFSPPPPGQPAQAICHETNVLTFSNAATPVSVLSSGLTLNVSPFSTAGWLNLGLDSANALTAHTMHAANNNGNTFHGLPVTGFEAKQFAKGNNVGGVFQFYSGVYRHRQSRLCTNLAGICS